MRGRPPKPSSLRLIEGNRGHRPVRSGEPQYEPLDPKPPRHLSRAARAVWLDYFRRLEPSGVLTDADGPALAELCEDTVVATELLRGIRAMERELQTRARAEGKQIPGNAATAFASTTEGRRLMASLRALSALIGARQAEFGMNPRARNRTGTAGSATGPLATIENLLGGN